MSLDAVEQLEASLAVDAIVAANIMRKVELFALAEGIKLPEHLRRVWRQIAIAGWECESADHAGARGYTISRWAHGLKSPSRANLAVLAHAFGCDVREFFEEL